MKRQRMDCTPSSSAGKQAQSEFIVEIFGDDLRIVVDFKNHVFAVA